MNIIELKRKNLILIEYLQSIITGFKIKPEYSTNQDDSKVIVVQEQMGEKIVFFGDCSPLFDYFLIDIFGSSIQEEKETSITIGNLIGQSVKINTTRVSGNDTYDEIWQIIFKQYSNPQTIEYLDIKRVGYSATMKCIVNKIYEIKREE